MELVNRYEQQGSKRSVQITSNYIKKIAHITDLHLDEDFPFGEKVSARKRLDNILDSIEQEGINHVVCTGDIGENEGIPYFFEQFKKMNLSIVLGNHDDLKGISKHHNLRTDYDSEKIYRSELQHSFKLIYLDSSKGSIDIEQLEWLKRELVSSRRNIIFIHHPIVGLDLKVDDIGKLKNREDLLKILVKAQNEITIFCGHYHMANTSVHKNVAQCITPAVAFQIKKETDAIEIDTAVSGYRIIQIGNNGISSEVRFMNNAN